MRIRLSAELGMGLSKNRKQEEGITFRVLNEIGIIDQLSRARFERVLGDDLNVSQFSVLNHFVRVGGKKSPSRLARIFQVTKAAMTYSLGKLETKGYVKIVPDPKDGRGKIVGITAAGRKAHARAIKATEEPRKKMMRALSQTKLKKMLPVLEELREYLDREREEYDNLIEPGPH